MASNARQAQQNVVTTEAFIAAIKASPSVVAASANAKAIMGGTESNASYAQLAVELGLGKYDPTSQLTNGVAQIKQAVIVTAKTGNTINQAISTSVSNVFGKNPFEKAAGAAQTVATTPTQAVKALDIWPNAEYKYNLPPHNWARMIKNTSYVSKEDRDSQSEFRSATGPRADYSAVSSSIGTPRRGVIWWFASQETPQIAADDIAKDQVNLATEININAENNKRENRQFGFIFPWNPTTIEIATGTANDISSIPDLFTGTDLGGGQGAQTLSLQLTINRQDDFAMLAGLAKEHGREIFQLDRSVLQTVLHHYVDEDKTFGEKFKTPDDKYKLDSLEELCTKGTMHDIEALYRVINGKGWKKFGLKTFGDLGTADLGFLYFTMVNMAIGPMMYSGIIKTLNVQHILFSKNMTPIISTITIGMDVRSTIAMSQTTGGTSTPVTDPATGTVDPATGKTTTTATGIAKGGLW